MRRVWWGLVLVSVVAAGAVVVVDVIRNPTEKPKGVCRALEVRVRGLESFRWDNGITESAATWGQVLTDGVSEAADADRSVIAAAVIQDDAGYDTFMKALPAASKPPARRLHDLVADPDRATQFGPDPAVEKDVTALMRLGHQECGFA